MKSSVYTKESERTAPDGVNNRNTKERLSNDSIINLLHAGIGLSTESAEFLDALKKHLYYGKPLDIVNLNEEIGDLMWYCAMALRETGSSFNEVMEKNITKLKARYPEKFNESNALTRDLKKERDILEACLSKTEVKKRKDNKKKVYNKKKNRR